MPEIEKIITNKNIEEDIDKFVIKGKYLFKKIDSEIWPVKRLVKNNSAEERLNTSKKEFIIFRNKFSINFIFDRVSR